MDNESGLNMRKIFIWLSIIFILAWTLLPFYSLIIISLAKTGSISELWPKSVTFEYYKAVIFGSPDTRSIWVYMKNSVIVCSVSSIVVIMLSVPCSYALSRWKSKSSNAMYMSYFILRMLPPISLIIPRIILLQNLHLIDTFLGLALIYIPTQIPVGVWLMRGFFDSTPIEFEEYAYIEGATYFKTFFRIVLPVNTNGVAVTSVFVFIYCYIEYIFAALITRTNAITLPPYIASFASPWEIRFQLMLAAALISTIPMIVLYAFAQRFIVKGITVGAVKQ